MSSSKITIKDELKQELTQNIFNQYDKLISDIYDNELFLFDDIIEKIRLYSISFDNNENGNYVAYADTKKETTVFNTHQTIDYTYTIIHELAHHIIDISKAQGKSGYHCLEFAIVTYAMMYKFIKGKDGFRTTFFKAYDIHEDIAYSSLSINISRFDDMIRALQWSTLTELVNESKRLAIKIRKKIF